MSSTLTELNKAKPLSTVETKIKNLDTISKTEIKLALEYLKSKEDLNLTPTHYIEILIGISCMYGMELSNNITKEQLKVVNNRFKRINELFITDDEKDWFKNTIKSIYCKLNKEILDTLFNLIEDFNTEEFTTKRKNLIDKNFVSKIIKDITLPSTLIYNTLVDLKKAIDNNEFSYQDVLKLNNLIVDEKVILSNKALEVVALDGNCIGDIFETCFKSYQNIKDIVVGKEILIICLEQFGLTDENDKFLSIPFTVDIDLSQEETKQEETKQEETKQEETIDNKIENVLFKPFENLPNFAQLSNDEMSILYSSEPIKFIDSYICDYTGKQITNTNGEFDEPLFAVIKEMISDFEEFTPIYQYLKNENVNKLIEEIKEKSVIFTHNLLEKINEEIKSKISLYENNVKFLTEKIEDTDIENIGEMLNIINTTLISPVTIKDKQTIISLIKDYYEDKKTPIVSKHHIIEILSLYESCNFNISNIESINIWKKFIDYLNNEMNLGLIIDTNSENEKLHYQLVLIKTFSKYIEKVI